MLVVLTSELSIKKGWQTHVVCKAKDKFYIVVKIKKDIVVLRNQSGFTFETSVKKVMDKNSYFLRMVYGEWV